MGYKIENGWIIGDIDGIKVERKPIGRPNGKPLIPTFNSNLVIVHYTEGNSIDGAWSWLEKSKGTPHLYCGNERIIQARPFGFQAASLRTGIGMMNKWAEVQIEVVGKSTRAPVSLPKDSSLRPFVNVLALINKELNIPMVRPPQFPDDLSDMAGQTIAKEHNKRRDSGLYLKWASDPKLGGIFNHMEVPYNSHWDMGATNWKEIIKLVNTKVTEI